jgi:DNA end-binding protein Ku
MGMRSNGSFGLSHSLVNCDVKMYKPFDDDAAKLKFHRLHSNDCRTQVELHNYCPKCEIEVPYAQLVKGYQLEDGSWITFSDAEIKSCEEEKSESLEIERFVPSIPALQFEGKMNFLVPDGKKDYKAFAILQQGMGEMYGIGRLVSRGADHHVALRAEGKILLMFRLRPFIAIRKLEAIPQYDAIQSVVAKAELTLMKQIVKLSTTEFVPESVVSTKSDRLHELLEAKRTDPDAVEQKLPSVPKARPNADLMEALKASLAKLSA